MTRPCALCHILDGTVAAAPWLVCPPCADSLAPRHPDPDGYLRHRTVEVTP